MDIFLMIIGAWILYLAVGLGMARLSVKRIWNLASDKQNVRENLTATTLLWPAVMPARVVNLCIDALTESSDPDRKERKAQKVSEETTRLERILGIPVLSPVPVPEALSEEDVLQNYGPALCCSCMRCERLFRSARTSHERFAAYQTGKYCVNNRSRPEGCS